MLKPFYLCRPCGFFGGCSLLCTHKFWWSLMLANKAGSILHCLTDRNCCLWQDRRRDKRNQNLSNATLAKKCCYLYIYYFQFLFRKPIGKIEIKYFINSYAFPCFIHAELQPHISPQNINNSVFWKICLF